MSWIVAGLIAGARIFVGPDTSVTHLAAATGCPTVALFGNLPDGEREAMQEKLGRIVADKRLSANITAGLGSVFTALADRYLKPGDTVDIRSPAIGTLRTHIVAKPNR